MTFIIILIERHGSTVTTKRADKREARDIQKRTGWAYQFCLSLVTALDYEKVSREIDDSKDLVVTRALLNERIREAGSARIERM